MASSTTAIRPHVAPVPAVNRRAQLLHRGSTWQLPVDSISKTALAVVLGRFLRAYPLFIYSLELPKWQLPKR
jgi:hypothetical protein